LVHPVQEDGAAQHFTGVTISGDSKTGVFLRSDFYLNLDDTQKIGYGKNSSYFKP